WRPLGVARGTLRHERGGWRSESLDAHEGSAPAKCGCAFVVNLVSSLRGQRFWRSENKWMSSHTLHCERTRLSRTGEQADDLVCIERAETGACLRAMRLDHESRPMLT